MLYIILLYYAVVFVRAEASNITLEYQIDWILTSKTTLIPRC